MLWSVGSNSKGGGGKPYHFQKLLAKHKKNKKKKKKRKKMNTTNFILHFTLFDSKTKPGIWVEGFILKSKRQVCNKQIIQTASVHTPNPHTQS
jgi:hypothetical protein